jgi:vitamin B12 transporter
MSAASARQVGSAVTVVTGEQLRAQQVRHAGDALRSLPGVSVSRSGGYGSKTQVRIRGAEGNHTLVLIDGIEANGTSDGDLTSRICQPRTSSASRSFVARKAGCTAPRPSAV